MTWTKAPNGLVALFAESLPDEPWVERRRMFGLPVAFVHGNMFAGLFQDQVFARMAPERRAALEAEHGPLAFEPSPGRPMKAYTRLPDDIVADDMALADLLAEALAFTTSLPPNEKKKRKPAPAGPGAPARPGSARRSPRPRG